MINKLIPTLLFAFICIFSNAQGDSLNMKRMAVLSGMGADYNDVWGYRHGSKEFAVIGSNSAINIVDVTDCANPVLEHQWIDGSSVIWRDFKEYEDYIYAVCDGSACNEGLQVINKNDFTQSQSLAQFRAAHNIFLENGRLYVVGSNTNSHGIYIYDVKTDPANPTLLKDVRFRDITNNPSGNYYVHDVYVKNDTAYCSHGYVGYRIWDMTDVNNISLISEYDDSNGYNHSSWRHRDSAFVYVAEEVPIGKPIYVYDVSDIQDPEEIHNFKDPLEAPDALNNRPHNPFVHKNRLYISYYHDGLQVYDLSIASNPSRIAYYDTYLDNNGNGYSGYEGAWGAYPFLPSGCLLVSDITYGLNTLKLDLIPESKSVVPSSDILIDQSNRGVVFVSSNDVHHRVNVNNDGVIQIAALTAPPTDRMEFVNSNLEFETTTNGVVFQTSIGKLFRLGIDNDGNLTTNSVDELGDHTKLTDEDLYFSQYKGGLIMHNTEGETFHITTNGLGTVVSTELED